MPPINDFTPPREFRFLRSEGTSHEVGIAHGRAFGDLIRNAVDVYKAKFEKVNVKWSDALVAAERGRGLGRAVTAAMLDWARAQGSAYAYLQVNADNAPAIRLYRTLGFTDAYAYHYRIGAA